MRHTLYTWTKTLPVYVEILTVRAPVRVFGSVIGWFNVRFHWLGKKTTRDLTMFKGSTCSLTSMTLLLITISKHLILPNHTRLLGIAPKSVPLLDLSGLR